MIGEAGEDIIFVVEQSTKTFGFCIVGLDGHECDLSQLLTERIWQVQRWCNGVAEKGTLKLRQADSQGSGEC